MVADVFVALQSDEWWGYGLLMVHVELHPVCLVCG